MNIDVLGNYYTYKPLVPVIESLPWGKDWRGAMIWRILSLIEYYKYDRTF